jgi:GTP-sensing pleiotropic transcriptional regulator CodY
MISVKVKGVNMLASLLGSKNAERALMFIFAREEGYAREIARFYETDLKSIQNQLDKLEAAGIFSSRSVGRTRPYVFNPRYPFLTELKNLLAKALTFYPEEERGNLVMNRRRPRGKGKAI